MNRIAVTRRQRMRTRMERRIATMAAPDFAKPPQLFGEWILSLPPAEQAAVIEASRKAYQESE